MAKGDFDFPLCNPLKTTKKGAAAPFLGFSPEFGLCGDRLRLAKRATDASLIDRRGSRNTLRLFRMPFAWKIVTRDTQSSPCRKNGLSTFIRQIFNGREQSDSHGVSCAWETQSDGRPKGVRTMVGITITRTTERLVFQARKRYSRPQRLFFAYFFLTSQKKVCRRRHPAPVGAEK